MRDLEVVLAIAASGSTLRAASILHVTQSAVSRGLLLAEEKLGVKLFERRARGLSPTAAGERLVAGARPLLGQLVELERASTRPSEAETVRLRVVCECYTAYRWLPSTLQALARATPGIEVEIAPEHTEAPVRALVDHAVDVALLTTSDAPEKMQSEALFSDEIVFVLAPTHPLARRPSLSRRDLTTTTLITSSATPAAEARWFFTTVFGKTKPKLSFLRFPLTEALIDAARAGMGVAILSEWIASTYVGGNDLVVKRFAGGSLRRPWRIAFRPESEGAARRLGSALAGAPPRLYAVR